MNGMGQRGGTGCCGDDRGGRGGGEGGGVGRDAEWEWRMWSISVWRERGLLARVERTWDQREEKMARKEGDGAESVGRYVFSREWMCG